jgi:hypothetical protein
MMNKLELIDYKAALEKELKAVENGYKRVKLDIDAKRKMIKLVEEQIKAEELLEAKEE